jgi:hypothetical protein
MHKHVLLLWAKFFKIKQKGFPSLVKSRDEKPFRGTTQVVDPVDRPAQLEYKHTLPMVTYRLTAYPSVTVSFQAATKKVLFGKLTPDWVCTKSQLTDGVIKRTGLSCVFYLVALILAPIFKL